MREGRAPGGKPWPMPEDDQCPSGLIPFKIGDDYVDPDSFILTKNPYPGSFVSHLYPLQNVLTILHSMHERDYNEHVK